MVKREQIESKIKGYVDENKVAVFEAMYMWSIGLNSQTIAGILNNKYSSSEALEMILNDLSQLEIRGPSERVEVTNEEVGTVIRETFRRNHQVLIDKIISECLPSLSELDINMLLVIIRSSLFERGRGIKLDDIKLAYQSLFGEKIKDRNLNKALLALERAGILYCERNYAGGIESIMIPEFVYSIEENLKAKLPNVSFSKGKEE